MKNIFTKLLMLSMVSILLACSDDEDPAPHIVGDWELEGFTLEDFASDFASYEGITLTPAALGISKASVSFAKDETFVEKITATTTSSYSGTWSLEDEVLSLLYEDEDEPAEVDVEKNEDDLFWYSIEAAFTLISDSTWDALVEEYGSDAAAQDYIDSLSDTEAAEYYSTAVCKMIWKYTRVAE